MYRCVICIYAPTKIKFDYRYAHSQETAEAASFVQPGHDGRALDLGRCNDAGQYTAVDILFFSLFFTNKIFLSLQQCTSVLLIHIYVSEKNVIIYPYGCVRAVIPCSQLPFDVSQGPTICALAPYMYGRHL